MDVRSPLRIWALLGPHRGDNNQVLALAQALGLPFEEKPLRYNALRRLQPALLGATFASVEHRSRALLDGEPPDLTISTGHRSVPVVRELKRRSGGRTRLVHLGYPRISPAHFDLVIPTPEYPVPDAPNVMRIPFALSPHSISECPPEPLRQHFGEPRRLFVVGGSTLYWDLPTEQMLSALRTLLGMAAREGGSVLVVGSPRTDEVLLHAIERELGFTTVPHLLAPMGGPPSYATLINAADSIFVTADSVAMVADAVMTGKPVGIVPIEKSALGKIATGLMDRLRPGQRLFPRDLRFFWAALKEHGFGGTLLAPRASSPPDYSALVAERVRRLLEQPPPLATDGPDSGR